MRPRQARDTIRPFSSPAKDSLFENHKSKPRNGTPSPNAPRRAERVRPAHLGTPQDDTHDDLLQNRLPKHRRSHTFCLRFLPCSSWVLSRFHLRTDHRTRPGNSWRRPGTHRSPQTPPDGTHRLRGRPHLRPLCAVHVCENHLMEDTPWTQTYWALREIAEEALEQDLMRATKAQA